MVSKFRILVESLLEGDKQVFDKETGYNISKDELYIYDILKEKYPNLIMSYTDDRIRNPNTNRKFQFDFYDPDSNTLMGYHKHWTHFSEKFNPDTPEHLEDVKWLENKAKDNEFYKKTLNKWTVNDPLKHTLAKETGMNYIVWYNMKEFENWLANPTLTYEEYKEPTSRQYDSDEYFDLKAQGYDSHGNDSDPYGV